MSKIKKMKRQVRRYLRKHWGPRCKSVDIDCACCQVWQAYDLLRGWPCLLDKIIDQHRRKKADAE